METDSEKKTKQYPKHCKILFIVSCTNDLNEYQLYNNVNRQADNEGELNHVAEERRHLDTFLFGNRFHHEVRAIANVGECSEENGTH